MIKKNYNYKLSVDTLLKTISANIDDIIRVKIAVIKCLTRITQNF
jgi:hypothetical protein